MIAFQMSKIQPEMTHMGTAMVRIFAPDSFEWKIVPHDFYFSIGVYLANDYRITYEHLQKIKALDPSRINEVWVEYHEKDDRLLCCCKIENQIKSEKGVKRSRFE